MNGANLFRNRLIRFYRRLRTTNAQSGRRILEIQNLKKERP